MVPWCGFQKTKKSEVKVIQLETVCPSFCMITQNNCETVVTEFGTLLEPLVWLCLWNQTIKWRSCQSCAGLESKATLEKSLNIRNLKKSLNCFGKRVEQKALKSLEFVYRERLYNTW